MARVRLYPLLLGSVLLSTTAWAGSPDDMINQLLPASQRPAVASPAPAPVLSVSAATTDQMIERLGSDLLARSIDPKTRRPQAVVLAPGHEAEDLTVFRALPSMQVAVAFQGSSDALAPDSDALFGRLADALTDKKLASYRFVIGVHTNSVGSDDYNLSLANLRAKAIVERLVATHRIPKNRLFAMGFGRVVDGPAGAQEPSERIRVVNLEDTVVKAAAEPAAPPPAVAHVTRAKPKSVARPTGGASRVARHRARPSSTARAEPSPSPRPKRQVQRRHAPSEYGRYRVMPGTDESTGWVPGAGAGTFDYAARTFNGGHGGNSGGGGSGGGGSGSGGGGSGGGGSGGGGGTGGGGGNSGGGGGGTGGGGGSGGGGGGTGGGGGGGHSSGWSDRRLKHDIRRIGTSPSGLAIFSFRYLWGGPVMVGVMAQDLLQTHPDAVLAGPSGYLMVDYAKLDVDMMTLAEWRRRFAAVA